MKTRLRDIGIGIVLVALIYIAARGVRSYRHFEWLTISNQAGDKYVIPSWRK